MANVTVYYTTQSGVFSSSDTVSWTLYTNTNSVSQTGSASQLASTGIFSAAVTHDAAFSGQIVFDNGNGVTANEAINLQQVGTLADDLGSLSDTVSTLQGLINTLTGVAVLQVNSAVVAGGAVTLQRGDQCTLAINGLGMIPSTRTKFWFTVKSRLSDPDAQSLLQVTELDGLTILNGDTDATAGDAVLSISDIVNGDLTIILQASVTCALMIAANYFYDIQYLNNDGTVKTLTQGTLAVIADVTRAIN